MTVTVKLNKAAYLILQGAILQRFEGKAWHNCRVVLQTTDEILHSKNLVDNQKYMKVRNKIKEKMYKAYNYKRY